MTDPNVIIYQRPDGGFDVVFPNPALFTPTTTEKTVYAALVITHVPEGAPYWIQPPDWPPDRRWQESWVMLSTGHLAVSAPAARLQRADELRPLQAGILAALSEEVSAAEDRAAATRVTALRLRRADVRSCLDEGYAEDITDLAVLATYTPEPLVGWTLLRTGRAVRQ